MSDFFGTRKNRSLSLSNSGRGNSIKTSIGSFPKFVTVTFIGKMECNFMGEVHVSKVTRSVSGGERVAGSLKGVIMVPDKEGVLQVIWTSGIEVGFL